MEADTHGAELSFDAIGTNDRPYSGMSLLKLAWKGYSIRKIVKDRKLINSVPLRMLSDKLYDFVSDLPIDEGGYYTG